MRAVSADSKAGLPFPRERVRPVRVCRAILIAQAFREMLLRRQSPKLVNITSGYGSLIRNTGGFPFHYGASKAPLNHYTRSFAFDPLTRGLTNIVMNPGWIRTNMGGPNASGVARLGFV